MKQEQMNNSTVNDSSTSSIKKIKKGIRRRTLFFLILALITNAFAWFIYSNKVSNSINTGVKSWKITFSQNGTTLSDDVVFNVNQIYPGMSNYSDHIDIQNSGEMAATVTYEITSAKVFETTYSSANYTSAQIENILANNYPFAITFGVTNPDIGVNDSTSFVVNIVWPYESGDDALDTYWGKKSYDFKAANPGVDEIELRVKIVAGQDN